VGSAPSLCARRSREARRQGAERQGVKCLLAPARKAAHQQVLVHLQVAVVLRQEGGAVQRREAARVALVHRLTAVADDVVQLRQGERTAASQPPAGGGQARAQAAEGVVFRAEATSIRSRVAFAKPHHVQLLVRGGEVHRRAGAVVLRPEVRVRVHDLRARARRYPGRREGWPACVASPRAAPWPAAPGRPGARWSRRQTAGSAAAAGSAPCLRGARRRFSAPALGSWRGASAGRGAKRTGHVAPHGCWTARDAGGRPSRRGAGVRYMRPRPTSPRQCLEGRSARSTRRAARCRHAAAARRRVPALRVSASSAATPPAHMPTARLSESKQAARGKRGAAEQSAMVVR
jgi:hypothetical protein